MTVSSFWEASSLTSLKGDIRLTFLGESWTWTSLWSRTLICLIQGWTVEIMFKGRWETISRVWQHFLGSAGRWNHGAHPVTEEKLEGTQFLPHHGVLRDDGQTTRLHIMFDWSAKLDQNQYSIKLMINYTWGVDQIQKLPCGTNCRHWKDFHQISVHPADQDRLRFLWFKNIEGEKPEIVQYHFCRLMFGLTLSPAILNGTIQHYSSH